MSQMRTSFSKALDRVGMNPVLEEAWVPVEMVWFTEEDYEKEPAGILAWAGIFAGIFTLLIFLNPDR